MDETKKISRKAFQPTRRRKKVSGESLNQSRTTANTAQKKDVVMPPRSSPDSEDPISNHAKDSQLDGNTQLINSSIRDRMVGPDFFQNRSRPTELVQDVFTVFPIKARRTNVDGMVVRRKRCSMILPGVEVSWSESATIG